MAYQRTKSYDRLSFMYLVTGNENNLKQMLKISELRNDPISSFQNAIYLGDVEERVRLLEQVGQGKKDRFLYVYIFYKKKKVLEGRLKRATLLYIGPLAYLTAKSHGLTEKADAILAQSGKESSEIQLPSNACELPAIPKPAVQLEDANWPLLTVSKSFFEGAFVKEAPSGSTDNGVTAAPVFTYDENVDEGAGDWGMDDDDNLGIPGLSSKASAEDDLFGTPEPGIIEEGGEGEEGGGWDLDDDIKADLDAEISQAAAQATAEFVAPTAGTNECTIWSQNSPLAADHIAAGSFEGAMQALNRQVGIVNFEPLKHHFLSIYQASRVSISPVASNPNLFAPIRRNPEESNIRSSFPVVVYSFENLKSNQLQQAYRLFTNGKLVAAAAQFKQLLHSVLFTVVTNSEEAGTINELIDVCREYITGLQLEQERRAAAGDAKRTLELAAYFTHCQLDVRHSQLALRQATKQAFKLKNFNSASQFARRLLELAPPKSVADEVK